MFTQQSEPEAAYPEAEAAPVWKHFCPKDRCWISVGKGEPCNWCDTTAAE